MSNVYVSDRETSATVTDTVTDTRDGFARHESEAISSVIVTHLLLLLRRPTEKPALG